MGTPLVDIDFENRLAKPTDQLPDSYSHKHIQDSHPPQTPDGEEYICGSTGPGFPGNNPGRSQDISRQDERVEAQAFARYVS